eukprot:6695106-Prymnesium_polylepis.1
MPQAAARAVDGAQSRCGQRERPFACSHRGHLGGSAVARPARALKLRKKRMDGQHGGSVGTCT